MHARQPHLLHPVLCLKMAQMSHFTIQSLAIYDNLRPAGGRLTLLAMKTVQTFSET